MRIAPSIKRHAALLCQPLCGEAFNVYAEYDENMMRSRQATTTRATTNVRLRSLSHLGLVSILASLSLLSGLSLASYAPANTPQPLNVLCETQFNTKALTALLGDTPLLMVGEEHGTQETPRLVGDIACMLAAAGKPTVVALEISRLEQEALERYLHADNTERAQAQLLKSPHWQSFFDGRNSTAMLALIGRIKTLRHAGLPISVSVTDKSHIKGSVSAAWPRDKAMAQALSDLHASRNFAHIVYLAGNYHTRALPPKTPPTPGTPSALAAPDQGSAVSLYLEDLPYLSVLVAFEKTSSWFCRWSKNTETTNCKIHGTLPPGLKEQEARFLSLTPLDTEAPPHHHVRYLISHSHASTPAAYPDCIQHDGSERPCGTPLASSD